MPPGETTRLRFRELTLADLDLMAGLLDNPEAMRFHPAPKSREQAAAWISWAAGMLMLSEEPLTLAQLQEGLGASKGSVSEMTRLLIVNGVVERFKEQGQRQFVFRWRADAWIGCLQHQLQSTEQLPDFARDAQDKGADLPEVQRRRLQDMVDYYVFIVRRLEGLLADYVEQWEAEYA